MAPAPVPRARALVWSDEFEGAAGAAPSSANWGYNIGRYGAGDGENQFYTNSTSNAALDGASNLVITARQEAPPDAASAPNNFTSARIVTKGRREFAPTVAQPLRFALRAKVPAAAGVLAQWWTIGAPDDWPHAGEIDGMESPSHMGNNYFAMNLHGPTQGAPSTDRSLGFGSVRHRDPLAVDFHVYGFDWWTDRIATHFDGRYTGQVTQAQYAAAGGDWTAFSGSWAHYQLLNIAIGNDWTGDPDGTTQWPVSMLIDWVRVYAL